MPNSFVARHKLPWLLFALALIVIALDQLTKHLAVACLDYLEVAPVTPFFYLTLRFNEGAAFSFLAGAGGWQRWFFATLAFVISIVLVIWVARIY